MPRRLRIRGSQILLLSPSVHGKKAAWVSVLKVTKASFECHICYDSHFSGSYYRNLDSDCSLGLSAHLELTFEDQYSIFWQFNIFNQSNKELINSSSDALQSNTIFAQHENKYESIIFFHLHNVKSILTSSNCMSIIQF